MRASVFVFAIFALSAIVASSSASYTVTNLNVTVKLNTNTSAQVSELFTIYVTNQSLSQYSSDRLALNLTLSNWGPLIGPLLVPHMLNTKSGIYNFKLLPTAVTSYGNGGLAYILMTYSVLNATTVNETAPRKFSYTFNPNIFNFAHGISGEVLTANTTLNIEPPTGFIVTSVYPLPDSPVSGFANNYANTTTLSWFQQEPLSKFVLTYTITESLQQEVMSFFSSIYQTLGLFTYVIIALAIILFVLYSYFK
jgi:hypothetical protein